MNRIMKLPNKGSQFFIILGIDEVYEMARDDYYVNEQSMFPKSYHLHFVEDSKYDSY